MRIKHTLIIILCSFSLSSCIIQTPKFSMVENVFLLKTGMSKEEVSAIMKTPPYDLKIMDQSGESIFIYKYRLRDRKTVPFLLTPTNGVKARGKYVDLFITFGPDNKATKIESCSECGKTMLTQQRININSLLTFISITLPSILLFLNLK